MEVQPMRAHPIAGISERECLSPERVSKESFKHMTFRDPFQDKAYVTSIYNYHVCSHELTSAFGYT